MSENLLLERLLVRFDQRPLVTVYEAADFMKPGITANAVRSSLSKKRFPLPTYKVMGARMCKVTDLAAFLVDPTIHVFLNSDPVQTKRGPGRPSKAEQVSRRQGQGG